MERKEPKKIYEKHDAVFNPLEKGAREILEQFDGIIQDIKPLNSRQLYQQNEIIKELSHSLTDERQSRRLGYMNDTKYLIAYARYFMWWNLVRLTPIFAGLETKPETRSFLESLTDDSVCIDMGSGPLTVVVALWLACPTLRKKALTWYCVDLSQTALSLGEELFLKVAAKTASFDEMQKTWNIIRVKGEFGTEIRKKADLFTCANMFNEAYWSTDKPLEEVSKKNSSTILSYCNEGAGIFVAEPGIPRAGRFVSLLRSCFIRQKKQIDLPCPFEGECPMEGKKGGKWCHFVLDATTAPKALQKLSEKAGLPKDRAAVSFVFAHGNTKTDDKAKAPVQKEPLKLRVVSDPIALFGGQTGRYCCSEMGLTLAVAPEKNFRSGDGVIYKGNKKAESLTIDRKSGAKMLYLQDCGKKVETWKKHQ